MKAIIVRAFGEPEVMHLEAVPEPAIDENQVLVSVRAAGVNPVDTYIRAGQYPIGEIPYTPGMDAAGVIEKVGTRVEKVKPGDRVYTAGTISGTYAQKALFWEKQVHLLPDEMSFEQGAALGVPYVTAHAALFYKAKAEKNDTVLIHGATGGVGIAAVQLAKSKGLTVLGTAGTDKGKELVRAQGADHVFDHHDEKRFDEIMKVTQGKGVKVILEMLANANLDSDLDVAAQNGTVVVIGSRGTVEIDPRKAMTKQSSIAGMLVLKIPENELEIIHASLQELMRNRKINPVIQQAFPLAEAVEAHHKIMESGHLGKIVLTI